MAKGSYLPRRYRRKKGHTNYDLAQKREAQRRLEGIPVTAVPASGPTLKDDDAPNRIDWCEPLDPVFRVR